MIIKSVRIRNRTTESLKELVRYISTNSRENRVIEVGFKNLSLAEPGLVAIQMESTVRCFIQKDLENLPYKHYILSWRKEQELANKINSKNLVEDFCYYMKFENCQYFFVKHGDTQNPHIHLVLNRIDTVNRKLIVCRNELGFEIRRLQETKKKLEELYKIPSFQNPKEENSRKYAYHYSVTISQKEVLQKIKQNKKDKQKQELLSIINILNKDISFVEMYFQLNQLGWYYYKSANTNKILLINQKKKVYFFEEKLPKDLHLVNIIERRKNFLEKNSEKHNEVSLEFLSNLNNNSDDYLNNIDGSSKIFNSDKDYNNDSNNFSNNFSDDDFDSDIEELYFHKLYLEDFIINNNTKDNNTNNRMKLSDFELRD